MVIQHNTIKSWRRTNIYIYIYIYIYISDVNEILKGNYYSAEQKSAIKNIKTLHESQEKVIKVFNDYY